MAYNINNFLVSSSPTDTRLRIRESSGVIKWVINPYDITSTVVSSNLVKINTKYDVITLDFTNVTIARQALTLLQTQAVSLRSKPPLAVDTQVVNYINGRISSSTGLTGQQGPQGPNGVTGSQGSQGFDGPQGDQGFQGPQGDQGFTGPQGPQGFASIYSGTSSTYLAVPDLGYSVEIETQPGLSYVSGQYVLVYSDIPSSYGDPDYDEGNAPIGSFQGIVDEYIPSTGRMVIISEYATEVGSTHSFWNLNLSGYIGPQGPAGSGGSGGTSSARNDQFFDSLSYTVTHNSGTYPVVQVLDNNNNLFIPLYVTHSSVNEFTVIFATSTSGTIITADGGGPKGATGPQGEQGPAGTNGGTASFTELSVTGTTKIQQVVEVLTTATAAFGLSPSTFDLNFNDGSIFYIEPEGDNFVANYLNVPTDDNRIISTTIVISQTSSAYIPNVVAINGDVIPISWANGSLPSGNVNQTDIVGFSFMRIGATWSRVFGQFSTFATI